MGFTRAQNVTRLNSYLNRTLVNKQLFGGTILSVYLNLSLYDSNNTNSTDYDNGDDSDDGDDDSGSSGKSIMPDQNLTNDPSEPTRTTQTVVTYTTLDKGLSITISETITITNNNFDKSPINNKNYELILVPSIDHTKTIVVPTIDINERPLSSPATAAAVAAATPGIGGAATTTTTTTTVGTTNVIIKSPSHHNLLRPIKPITDTNFAYIDESSDDHTFSSGDGIKYVYIYIDFPLSIFVFHFP